MATPYEAEIRHAAYYCNVLNIADKFYVNGGVGAFRGLQMLDIEWANIDKQLTLQTQHCVM